MTPSALTLRRMNREDIAILQRIECSARQRYLSAPPLAAVATAPALAAARFAAGVTCLAARDGEVLGFVLVQYSNAQLYIASIMVTADCSGLGIGQALLDWAEGYAMSLAANCICLTTFRDPPWTAPWFIKQGYSAMPEARIGQALRQTLQRQASFLDLRQRITLWKPPPAPSAS